MSATTFIAVALAATTIGLAAATAQAPAPADEANRNAIVGLYAIKEICRQQTPAKSATIEANFAKQTSRASPEVLAWTKTPEFSARAKKRVAEQRALAKKPDGAALLEGFCENLVK